MTARIAEPRAMADQVDVEWDWAFDCSVNGRYIDFTSGIFVANVGHSHPRVVQAIWDQIETGPIHTYTFPNARRRELCAKLCEMSGFEKAALFSTGSEAVEAAIRVARTYTKRDTIVSWIGSMHGKTLGAQQLSTGGPNVIRYEWDNLPVVRWPFTLPRTACDVAAVIVETYHGWGARWFPVQYIKDVAAWCRDNCALLIFDEIQAGFGRTGSLFGYEWYGVIPDLVICGKGLGGGMPISAVLGSAEALDSDPSLTSTHSGNPVCCGAALATLDVIEQEELVERADYLGRNTIEPRLASLSLPNVSTNVSYDLRVHGRGCAWAVWLNQYPRYDETAIAQANAIVDLAETKGLLLLKTNCGTIKIGPPLTIPVPKLIVGLNILKDCIQEVLS